MLSVASHKIRQSLHISEHAKADAKAESKGHEHKNVRHKTTSLYVCNGFHSPDGDRSATLKHKKSMQAKDYKEGGTLLTTDRAINYGDCQMFSNLVPFKKNELIEVYFSGSNSAEINGAFELSKTPNPDETLMLVMERVGGSLSFRSFAFPQLTASDSYAQVAVVDAHIGRIGRNAVLSLEDQVERTDKQLEALVQFVDNENEIKSYTARKSPQMVRIEEVEMNNIYAIQPGTYQAEIVEASEDGSRTHVLGKEVALEPGKNYIVMRTGYDNTENLVVFPNADANSGGWFCGWFWA
jgi:hypothetical protein